MNRQTAANVLCALLSLSAFACEKPGVTELQKESNAKQEAKNAAQEAERQAQGVQAAADKTIAAARADFDQKRADYLHGKRLDLADLDRRIADLSANAKIASGKSKADAQTQLWNVHAQREAYARHLESLQTVTPAAWDNAATELGKEWDALKAAVDNVE